MAGKFKTAVRNFVIPANTAANAELPLEFSHNSGADYANIVAVGFAEASNPNNIHYNIGLKIHTQDTPTFELQSKKFLATDGSNNVSDRIIPIATTRPSDSKSSITLQPTSASGNADIVVQVLFRYEY